MNIHIITTHKGGFLLEPFRTILQALVKGVERNSGNAADESRVADIFCAEVLR